MYKKQIRIIKILYGGQGFSDQTYPMTDWMEEEEGIRAFVKYREQARRENWCCDVVLQDRYVKVEEHY